MGYEVLVPIFGILVVLIPITGLTAVLTLRLGGKPFVETVAREFLPADRDDLNRQIQALSDQVETLTSEVRELHAAQAFDQRLLEARSETQEV